MFVEKLDDVPESWRDNFVEAENKDGVKGFQDKDSVELKNHLFNVKAENKSYIEKNADLNNKFTEIEAAKAAEIEAARAEALDKARSSKDVEAIETRYQEQLADLSKRSDAKIAEYDERFNALTTATKNKAIDAMVNDLASMSTEKGREAFKRLIRGNIDYDAEKGDYIFLDDSGGATSLDKAGFKADLANNSIYGTLLAADVTTTGAGNANGSQHNGVNVGVPKTLEECKGDRKLEAAFFNSQFNQ